jgi:hypothetical protein
VNGLLHVLALGLVAAADRPADDEFKVKRQEAYEFTQKPLIQRHGDQVTIAFASKALCDATVAIEDEQGRIVRHLASGVLGANAPEPFQKNSRSQTVVWDGKNDQGVYLDDKDRLTVRVSLGLRPQFEKTLYWSPYKRISQAVPLIQASAEGVFVFEGAGVDSLKQFDHQGRYVRTLYPFAADRYPQVKGLEWYDFPQGLRLPLKQSLYQQTLLTSGDNASVDDKLGRTGRAATAMAVCGGRIALVYLRLNRLATDGTTGGLNLAGGKTGVDLDRIWTRDRYQALRVGPTSAAFSPDGKVVYLAGYAYRPSYNFDTMHGVKRIAFETDADAEVFLGEIALKDSRASGHGAAPGRFGNATSVDCDAQGRVYVSDFMNDRVQVFAPDGTFLKAIPCFKPAVVRVHRRTGALYVFSWMVPSRLWQACEPPIEVAPTLTHFGPVDDPRPIARFDIPMGNVRVRSNGRYGTYTGIEHALWFNGELDSWTDPPTFWIGRECRNDMEAGIHPGDGGQMTPWESAGIKLLQVRDGQLRIIRDFGLETVKEVVQARAPSNAIQRLEVNPLTGKLYVGEADSGPTIKCSNRLLEIDPETGAIKFVDLPFNAMEYVFDLDGQIYLRSTDMIARYDFQTWREAPWDYGEERERLGNDGGIFGKTTPVAAGLAMPSKSPVCFHQGGIHVSPKGAVIASCAYRFVGISGRYFNLDEKAIKAQGRAYQPTLYPGRVSNSTAPCIHVWDKHGRILYEDAVPGVGQVDGVGLDRDDNIYLMHTPARVVDGRRYFNEMTETLMKVKPGRAKVLCSTTNAPVPLPAETAPTRPPDLANAPLGRTWVENAEWFYGGVGYAGFNSARAGGGCACWFSRFALDYFGRSIAPETNCFSVAVLDTNGNLITRVGRLGNVDDDRAALFHACYVGTHTDRRLFISDVGNARLLSLRLGYHVEEKVPLKSVPDRR